jgi:multidrug resistance efflux pump
MIVFLFLTYCAILLLLIWRKVIPNNLFWKTSPILWLIFLEVALQIPMQWGAPSGPLRLYQTSIEVVPNVSGPITTLHAQARTPIKRGDPLFTIDPIRFQLEVDRLRAGLAEAEQYVPQLEAAVKTASSAVDAQVSIRDLASADFKRSKELKAQGEGLISQADFDQSKQRLDSAEASLAAAQSRLRQVELEKQSNIDGENTKVAQLRAQLKKAERDLADTTVRAPIDGYIPTILARPGESVSSTRTAIQIVDSRESFLVLGLSQYVARNVRVGQRAEFILKFHPGKTYSAQVASIAPITEDGSVINNGVTPPAPNSTQGKHIAVFLKLTDDSLDLATLPGGVTGQAAIYTESARMTHPIRKVLIRMQTFLNYFFP